MRISGNPTTKRDVTIFAAVMIFFIVFVSFSFLFFDMRFKQKLIEEGRTSLISVSHFFVDKLGDAERAAVALSLAPGIQKGIQSGSKEDLASMNAVLDRFNSSFGNAVTYVMDAKGMTIASSNRDTGVSFVGKSYAFRPYFKEAMRGDIGKYFALGVTSGKRGFYASHPVTDAGGDIIGVVVVKKELESMGVFFKQQENCFLVNADGIIFISSTPELLYKSMWPVTEGDKKRLIESKQMGPGPFDNIMNKDFADETVVKFMGESMIAFRDPIGIGGWTLIKLKPLSGLYVIRAGLWMVTVAAVLYVLGGAAVIYNIRRTMWITKMSESKFRELFESTSDGVVIYDVIKKEREFVIKDINKAALRIENVDRDKIIGKDVREVFPGIKKMGLLEVFKRVAVSGVPERLPSSRYKDAKREGWRDNYVFRLNSGEIVATYNDTTEYENMLVELNGKIEELNKFHDVAVDREMKMIELKERIKRLEGGA